MKTRIVIGVMGVIGLVGIGCAGSGQDETGSGSGAATAVDPPHPTPAAPASAAKPPATTPPAVQPPAVGTYDVDNQAIAGTLNVEQADASSFTFSLDIGQKTGAFNQGALDHVKATVTGGKWVYASTEAGEECHIELTPQAKAIELAQDATGSCGFGLNVDASGVYTLSNADTSAPDCKKLEDSFAPCQAAGTPFLSCIDETAGKKCCSADNTLAFCDGLGMGPDPGP